MQVQWLQIRKSSSSKYHYQNSTYTPIMPLTTRSVPRSVTALFRPDSDRSSSSSGSDNDSDATTPTATKPNVDPTRNYSNLMHAYASHQLSSTTGTLPAYTKVMYAFHENRMPAANIGDGSSSSREKAIVPGGHKSSSHGRLETVGSAPAGAGKTGPVQRLRSEGTLATGVQAVEEEGAGALCLYNTPEACSMRRSGDVEARIGINDGGGGVARRVTDPTAGSVGAFKAKDWATKC